jgi:hypothetical protein
MEFNRSFRGKGRAHGGQGRNYTDRSQSRSIRSILATRFESSLALLYTYIQAAIVDLQSTSSDQLGFKINQYNTALKLYQHNDEGSSANQVKADINFDEEDLQHEGNE